MYQLFIELTTTSIQSTMSSHLSTNSADHGTIVGFVQTSKKHEIVRGFFRKLD